MRNMAIVKRFIYSSPIILLPGKRPGGGFR